MYLWTDRIHEQYPDRRIRDWKRRLSTGFVPKLLADTRQHRRNWAKRLAFFRYTSSGQMEPRRKLNCSPHLMNLRASCTPMKQVRIETVRDSHQSSWRNRWMGLETVGSLQMHQYIRRYLL